MKRRGAGPKGKGAKDPAAKGGPGRLRIIGGQWRGRKLAVADAAGLRPTGDRLRETLFNWLAADIAGARCLDLFAGSGALGFEALSRGAAHCDFVERQAAALAGLRAGIETLDAGARARVIPGDALAFPETATAPYDLVFLDPPFDAGLLGRALADLCGSGALAPDALVYVERARAEPVQAPPGLELHKEKTAGNVTCTLYRYRAPAAMA